MGPRRAAGFTLVELLIALSLLALMSGLLYGTLSLSATSWDRGEAKATQAGDMRLTEEFLRQSLTAQHPLRLHKVADQPLYFQGTRDSLAFAGVMPGRAGGGIYYFRLAVKSYDDKSRLTLARVIPDYAATTLPDFSGADESVLAEGIAGVTFGYFGRDPDSDPANPATCRDHWDDPQTLPLMIRVDVTPVKGPAWPTLVVLPLLAPEVGCRSWDSTHNRCAGTA
jgi:general secretion pathway protein J